MNGPAPEMEAAGSKAPEALSPAPSASVEIAQPRPFGGPGALKAEVHALRIEVAQLRAQVAGRADLNGTIEAQGLLIADLQVQLARLASAVGRADVLTPPATIEQLRAAHLAGQDLLVLRDLSIAGPPALRLTAGARVEARQYPLDRLVELLEAGKLHVAVVR